MPPAAPDAAAAAFADAAASRLDVSTLATAVDAVLGEVAASGQQVSYKDARHRVESRLGLPFDALKQRRKAINALVDAAVQRQVAAQLLESPMALPPPSGLNTYSA